MGEIVRESFFFFFLDELTPLRLREICHRVLAAPAPEKGED